MRRPPAIPRDFPPAEQWHPSLAVPQAARSRSRKDPGQRPRKAVFPRSLDSDGCTLYPIAFAGRQRRLAKFQGQAETGRCRLRLAKLVVHQAAIVVDPGVQRTVAKRRFKIPFRFLKMAEAGMGQGPPAQGIGQDLRRDFLGSRRSLGSGHPRHFAIRPFRHRLVRDR